MDVQVKPSRITARVTVHQDPDARPDEDCYTPGDKRRWYDDEWGFLGVMLTVEVWLAPDHEVVMTTYESLWGIESGGFSAAYDASDYVNEEVIPDLLTKCVERCRTHGVSLDGHHVAAIRPYLTDIEPGEKGERYIDLAPCSSE